MPNLIRSFKMALIAVSLTGLVACGANTTPAPSVAQPTQSQSTVPTSASAQATSAAQPTRASQSDATTAQPTRVAQATQPAIATIKKINLNTATAEQILTVPNAGQRMVREFQEYRPWTSVLQFRREIGKYVDAAQVAAYEKYVYVPIVPNKSDAATLQQLPGVDATIAAQLIAARPYANKDAFLKKLAELTPAEQAAMAGDMVDAQ